jgi:hypothetical protein
MSKARNLSDFISDATVDSTEIADLSVTHAKLHTDMNLSGKTLTFAANQISGNSVDGGVISNFASTGIDDNASATALTITSGGNVGIGTTNPPNLLSVRKTTTAYEDVISIIGQNSPTDIMGALAYDQTNDTMIIRNDQSFATGGIAFRAGGTADHLFIRTDGNVGIGTSTPSSPKFSASASGILELKGSKPSFNVQESDVTDAHFNMSMNGGNAYLGATGTGNLIFATGTSTWSERVRINSSGNVGIGETNPSYSLDMGIGKTIRLRHTTANGSAIRVGASDYDVNLIRFDGSAGITDNAYYGGALRYMGSRAGDANSLSIFMDNALGTEVEAMTIRQSGNVGIGTSSPNNALRVVASASQATTDGAVVLKNEMNNGFETLKLETNNGRDSILSFRSTGTNSYWWGMGIDNSDGGKFKMGADNLLGVNNRLVITQSGNVGIGTTSPIEALDVDGAIVSGNSSKPINATYDAGGDMNSFEHRFTRVKAGANSPHVLVDIQFTENFHQAMFVIEYGARLQAVSDSTTNAVIRSFGVNRFNGGNCNITETNNTHFNSNVSNHAPIYINVVSQTRYQIVVNFSSTVQGSSFVSGSIRGYGVSSEFPTITFSDGMNGH